MLSGLLPPVAAPADPHDLQRLVQALHQAHGSAEAMQLGFEIEAMREQGLAPTVRLLLRRAQREQASDQHKAALDDLDDALELQPDNALLWRERAALRAAAGDFDGAVGDLGGALSRDASDVLAWQALAHVEEGRDAWSSALQAWQHVMSLDPAVEGGAKRLEQLKRRAYGQPT